jgi:excinuclease ABC subunit B
MQVEKGDRVLVTTLTKKMAEEMDRYLSRIQIKSKYIHSDIDALERVEILRELRLGVIDVLVGVNLLREGLDLPEVSLVVVLDADKEGFLRNEKSLTQTAGRAARNVNGRVIFYADQITKSMRRTMDETDRRRAKQIKYNAENNITPTTIIKSIEQVMAQSAVLDIKGFTLNNINIKTSDDLEMVTNTSDAFKTIPQIEKAITQTKKQMDKFAKALDFMEAAKLRDEMFRLEAQLEKMKNT